VIPLVTFLPSVVRHMSPAHRKDNTFFRLTVLSIDLFSNFVVQDSAHLFLVGILLSPRAVLKFDKAHLPVLPFFPPSTGLFAPLRVYGIWQSACSMGFSISPLLSSFLLRIMSRSPYGAPTHPLSPPLHLPASPLFFPLSVSFSLSLSQPLSTILYSCPPPSTAPWR